MSRCAPVLLLCLLVACGDDGGGSGPDAAGDAGLPASLVSPPRIEWLEDGAPPVARPAFECPSGWDATTSETGVTTCEPWPATGPATCGDDEVHVIGSEACTPVGAPCPSSDGPQGLPAGTPVVHVRAGATGGDGTPGAPFGALADALRGAGPGAIVAIGRGTWDEVLTLRSNVTLWGTCPAQTILTSTVRSDQAVLNVRSGATVTVRNLTLADAERIAIEAVGATAHAELRDVVLRGDQVAGVSALSGATVVVEDSAIRDIQVGATSVLNGMGHGVHAQGSRVEVRRTTVERARGSGVFAGGAGTDVVLEDVAVLDTRVRETDLTEGRGLNAQGGAGATLTRVAIERSRNIGVFVGDADSAATLTDVVVRDTEAQMATGRQGRGIGVEMGGTLSLARVLVERNRDVGVFVGDTGTAATVADLVVRDTEFELADFTDGRALTVQREATAAVTRMVSERNRDVAVGVIMSGNLTLDDALVRATRPDGLRMDRGRALVVQDGSRVEARRIVIADNRENAVFVARPRAFMRLEDAVVRNTETELSEGSFGRGIGVELGASAELTRVLIDANREMGLFANGDGTLQLADVIVRDTRSEELYGILGSAVFFQAGASVTGERIAVERNRDVGVIALAATATLEDVAIVDVAEKECGATGCPDRAAGDGASAVQGGSLTLTRFSIERAARCGVLVGAGSDLDLSEGEVAESVIGACVQDPSFDLARLMRGVRYRNNTTQIDTTALPVPEPATSLPGI